MNSINMINPNLSPISTFNKSFNQSLEVSNQNLSGNSIEDFSKILDNQMQKLDNPTMNGGISATGVDTFSANIIQDLQEIQGTQKVEESGDVAGSIVKSTKSALESLNNQQLQAEHAVETLASGGDISIHDVMIASQKANLSMQMGIQLRNKLLSAYNELYKITM